MIQEYVLANMISCKDATRPLLDDKGLATECVR
jgi:hypothetical protein